MNMDKRKKYKIMKTDDIHGICSLRRVTTKIPLCGEYDTGYTEVEKVPSTLTDKTPVQYGFFTLQNSKLHFLKCLTVLHEFCDVSAMRLVYCDTGELKDQLA